MYTDNRGNRISKFDWNSHPKNKKGQAIIHAEKPKKKAAPKKAKVTKNAKKTRVPKKAPTGSKKSA